MAIDLVCGVQGQSPAIRLRRMGCSPVSLLPSFGEGKNSNAQVDPIIRTAVRLK